MRRLAYTAELSALFLLVTMTLPAFAECAWVLWESARPGYEPQRIEATLTQAGCWWSAHELARQRLKGGKSQADWKILGTRTGYSLGSVSNDGDQIVEVEWSCWPDAVDPRGPKAK